MLDFIRDNPLTIPEDASKMQDILDIEGVFIPSFMKYLPHLIWAIFILALIVLALYFFKKWRKNKKSKLLSPVERFQSDIKKLELQKFIEKGEIRKYYFFLSEILRRFIEDFCGYPALDKTQEEIEREFIPQAEFTPAQTQALTEFLQTAQRIKFAGQTRENESIQSDLESIKKWVLEVNQKGEK